MGVYIPKMEMPICCGECPVICDYDLSQEARGKEKSEHCPLIELKPHGRLIDADALMEKAFRYQVHGKPTLKVVLASALRDAPTIIEAEVDDE